MNNIFDIYNFILFVSDKDGKGYVTPNDAGKALGLAEMEMFNAFRGQDRLNNVSPPALGAFLKTEPFAAPNGVLAMPPDIVDVKRIMGRLEFLPILQNGIRDAEKSQLAPINKYPRYFLSGNEIQLLPRVSASGTITYLRLPAQPVIGYTVVNGDFIYNPATSVELEMPKQYWPDIVRRALAYIGVSIADADLLALTNQTPQ